MVTHKVRTLLTLVQPWPSDSDGDSSDRCMMLAAHLDEIGFIHIQPIGGFNARVLFAQRVLVHGYAGEILRSVMIPSSKPIYLLGDGRPSAPKQETGPHAKARSSVSLFLRIPLLREEVSGETT